MRVCVPDKDYVSSSALVKNWYKGYAADILFELLLQEDKCLHVDNV